MGLEAPTPQLGYLLGQLWLQNCMQLRAADPRQGAFVQPPMQKELPRNPHSASQSQPPHGGHWHSALGMQEEGMSAFRNTTPRPCARRSGWQMLPALAAMTHRCRAQSQRCALPQRPAQAVLSEDARWRMYLYPVTRAE